MLGDREAAADVAQDVALTALEKAGSLRDPRALDAWLHRVAVRRALRESKRTRARRDAEIRAHRRRRARPARPGCSTCSPASRRASAPR